MFKRRSHVSGAALSGDLHAAFSTSAIEPLAQYSAPAAGGLKQVKDRTEGRDAASGC
jgi:hypothetical protein